MPYNLACRLSLAAVESTGDGHEQLIIINRQAHDASLLSNLHTDYTGLHGAVIPRPRPNKGSNYALPLDEC